MNLHSSCWLLFGFLLMYASFFKQFKNFGLQAHLIGKNSFSSPTSSDVIFLLNNVP